jgi:hypothetical protein
MRLRVLILVLIIAVAASVLCQRAAADDTPHMGTTMMIKGQKRGVYVETDVNERTRSFNQDIEAHGIKGHIISCSLLIDLPAGVVGGDHSYGGYCKFVDDQGAKKIVQLCNDDMVGHFELQPADPLDTSEDALAEFVAANCIGG